ncbi:MAG TPA: glycosyltransferase family 2 protein [Solirubrobacteraceae bacterium]|jgi:GT2 family glycosyltransferase|nr:glycosyltransferase family 2 protein [Solirubrobacteraceae bacterium]
MSRPSSVSVVIPSLCGDARLIALVDVLARGDASEREVEVLIADNGLRPESRMRLREVGGRVLPMGRNCGFGAAVNRAATLAEGTLLAVLNDDIIVARGFLKALLGPVDRGEPASAGVLLAEESAEVIETAGVVIDRFLGGYDHLQGESVAILARRPPPPLGPCGGAGAWRRDTFLELGGFDERFFAYCEDIDLAIRMSLAGLRCALAVEARARHAGSSTLGYHSLAKAQRVGESRGALMAKYGLLRRPASAAWVLGSELVASVELARRHRSLAPARARIAGYRRARRLDPTVSAPPGSGAAAVTLLDGLSRRYRRSQRPAAT